MKQAKTVDAYIAQAPAPYRSKLRQLRAAIRKGAPKGTVEKISYGMAYYSYKGRLAYFALAKHHLGVYALLAAFKQYKTQVAPYQSSVGTLRFALDKKLPTGLITKLVKAQAKFNEAKSKVRKR